MRVIAATPGACTGARAGGARRALLVLWRALGAVAAVTTLTAVWSVDAHAEASWRLEPAQAPPPPAGVAPAPYPVPVGQVGEISFWAPNRGLLITGGTEVSNGPVAPGLYAYDGVSWHQLSNVCGGAEGRIAWAGPDEFWTISDQRSGQLLAPNQQSPEKLKSVSLCHFVGGQVVGSYAMPLEEPGSYLHMDAAACFTPKDCWFAGEDGGTPNVGAFHLHWDGSTVTASYEPEDHAVTSTVEFEGELYESVQVQEHDVFLPAPIENPEHPAVIHTIAPAGGPSACGEMFCNLVIFPETEVEVEGKIERKRVFLPRYGKGVLPDALQGFNLATDGAPTGAGVTQLWAAAGPLTPAPTGSARASLTVLRDTGGEWAQIIPNAKGETPPPLGETTLAGAETNVNVTTKRDVREASEALAPEPGGDSAWLSLHTSSGHGAEVARLEADGKLAETDILPAADEQVGDRGEAGPIACPAPHDCWLATIAESGPAPGWLFHLSDGAPLEPNTDPLFDGEDGVISYRPPDSGVPVIYPDTPPVDDSLANQQPPPAPAGASLQTAAAPVVTAKGKPLLTHVKSRLLNHRVLAVSFTLSARAHVQLLGRRRHKVVASTSRESLKPGHHELSLRLDPARWPTGVQFLVTPIGSAAPSGGGSGGSESNDTIST